MMENHNSVASSKFMKTSSNSSSSSSTSASGLARGSQAQQPFRVHAGSAGTQKDRCSDKSKVANKTLIKEQTKPLEVKLHTQLRSIRRAGFDYLVACKTNIIERQRQEVEMLQKLIEEEEIRRLRKEMIPRAQLMPVFDRPFFPQRSRRPLTVPKEPNFHSFANKSWRCVSSGDLFQFHHFNNQSRKPIK